MKLNSRYKIKTNTGFQDFLGVKRTKNTGLKIELHNNVIIKCTKDHRILVGNSKSGKIFRRASKLKLNDKVKGVAVCNISTTPEDYYYDPVNVENGHTYLCDGITHHNCAVIDEAAFIRTSVWDEFIDAFLPSQAALSWKKNIILSTPKGMNHFFDLVKGASPKYSEDGSGIKEPGEIHNGYKLFKVDWKDVPRYDSKGNRMKNEEFMKKIIDKHGQLYWNQNFACAFLGSSATLISSEKLRSITSKQPEEIRDGKLNVYHYPQKGHQYIISVDASKDGKDAFAVQITDITNFNFKQAAAAKLQIDYLLMPEFLDEWGRWYNNAFMIIENNEGAGQSIADQMYQTYEYDNLYFDKDVGSKKKKKYPGFRTTTKSRKLILQTMKTFIENNNLEINDKSTIGEFFTFILINNKYQADDGSHDDMIMALALTFAPFVNSKNFEDMKKVISLLYTENINNEIIDISEIMSVGSFDDGTIEDETYKSDTTYNNQYDFEMNITSF